MYQFSRLELQFAIVDGLRSRSRVLQFNAADLEHFFMEDLEMSVCQNTFVDVARPLPMTVERMPADRLLLGRRPIRRKSDVGIRSQLDRVWVRRPGTFTCLRQIACSETAKEQA